MLAFSETKNAENVRSHVRATIASLLAGLVSAMAGHAATYYVSTTGSDGNPGTIDLPFRWIQKAVDVSMPGDTIIVRDGTYGHGTMTHLGGDAEGPCYPQTRIRQKNGSPGLYLTIRAEHKWGAVLDCEYVSDASPGCDAAFLLETSSYVAIEDFVIRRGYWAGIYSANGSQSHHIAVRGNRFENIGNRVTATLWGIAGVFVGDGNHDWKFERNMFHDVGRIGGDAFSHDHALYLYGQNHSVFNNVFYAPITGWGVQTANGFSGVIANNTFAFVMRNNGGHIMLWGKNSDVTIRNNIFYQPADALAVKTYDLNMTRCSIDHNIVYGGAIGDAAGCSFGSNVVGDPLFVNAAAAPYDFRLNHGSPAMRAGLDVPEVTVDFDGIPRPSGNYDIGAYQSSGGGALPAPAIAAVTNGASFDAPLAPGTVISIFGTGLGGSIDVANVIPLPRRLGSTTVTARCAGAASGFELPLYYVSPVQINAQLPSECSGLEGIELRVKVADVVSAPYWTRLLRTAPGVFGVFSGGSSRALLFDTDSQLVDAIRPGVTLTFYATGLGPAPTGEPPSAVAGLDEPPRVFIGDRPAQVLWAGVAPGMIGVYQVNATIPDQPVTNRMFIRSNRTAPDTQAVDHADAWQSNIAEVPISAGNNILNWTGSIAFLYPTPTSWTASFSPAFVATTFSARFTIKPGAAKFTVAAVNEAGGSYIEFDPAQGTFEAFVTVPARETRTFRFGEGTEIMPMDFTACTLSDITCPYWRFPGDAVPASRLDPALTGVLESMPEPNEGPPAGDAARANARLHVTGSAPAGSEFIIDATHHPELATFGGFVQIPFAPYTAARSTTAQLFIDGRLISTARAEHRLPVVR